MSPLAILLVSAILEGGLLLVAFYGVLPRLGIPAPIWVEALVIGAWVLYEISTFRIKLRALSSPQRFGPERLTGRRGLALTPIDDDGRVQVDREIWRARREGAAIGAGDEVEVIAREKLRLVVRLAPQKISRADD